MNADHFRKQAAQARELARTGDDIHLCRMLLEVASDMEAEADAIDAEHLIAAKPVSPDAGGFVAA